MVAFRAYGQHFVLVGAWGASIPVAGFLVLKDPDFRAAAFDLLCFNPGGRIFGFERSFGGFLRFKSFGFNPGGRIFGSESIVGKRTRKCSHGFNPGGRIFGFESPVARERCGQRRVSIPVAGFLVLKER